MEDLLKRCRRLHNSTINNAPSDPVKGCQSETELGPQDSISQIVSCQDAASTTSNKLLARQLDLYCRRAALRAIHVRDLARAETKAMLLVPLRRGCESERQNLKLNRNTLLSIKVAHRWGSRGDMNINFVLVVQ